MQTIRKSCTNCRDRAVNAVAPLDREGARLRAYEALLEIFSEECPDCKHNREGNIDSKDRWAIIAAERRDIYEQST
jgi:hypothetical protein